MTNIEIEDVLSSIRRLVTDDLRPATASFVSSRTAESGKLLLTPALRVGPHDDSDRKPARVTLLHLQSGPTMSAISGSAQQSGTDEWRSEGDAPEAPHTFTDESWQQEWETSDVIEAPWAQQSDVDHSTRVDAGTADASHPRIAEAVAPNPLPSPAINPAPAFDEERLRDIVRDIIREELQGPLGERITRNVRKLVRAEINRAYVSRDIR